MRQDQAVSVPPSHTWLQNKNGRPQVWPQVLYLASRQQFTAESTTCKLGLEEVNAKQGPCSSKHVLSWLAVAMFANTAIFSNISGRTPAWAISVTVFSTKGCLHSPVQDLKADCIHEPLHCSGVPRPPKVTTYVISILSVAVATEVGVFIRWCSACQYLSCGYMALLKLLRALSLTSLGSRFHSK